MTGFWTNGTDGGQNQTAKSPNASYLHSQQNRFPILESAGKQRKDQANKNDAGHRRNPSRMVPPGARRAGRESRKESSRATRTLTLIFIVLIVSTLPWSILVIIYCLCPSCIPLVLYQVCKPFVVFKNVSFEVRAKFITRKLRWQLLKIVSVISLLV